MIERDFVKQRKKEHMVRQFITNNLKNVGHSYTELQRTPLGDKVVIHTSRPGLIVGRKGQNISKLTQTLQSRFNLENPQVEISEVEAPDLDANIVAERIASALERFGSNRFKGIIHRAMEDVLRAGAMGVEIRLSGKVPSSRAKSWRIYSGHLKKCGDAAVTQVRKSIIMATLKSGAVGIQVKILPPAVSMPDHIAIKEPAAEAKEEEKPSPEETGETPAGEKAEENSGEKKEEKPKRKKRKPAKKKETKKKEPSEGTSQNESS